MRTRVSFRERRRETTKRENSKSSRFKRGDFCRARAEDVYTLSSSSTSFESDDDDQIETLGKNKENISKRRTTSAFCPGGLFFSTKETTSFVAIGIGRNARGSSSCSSFAAVRRFPTGILLRVCVQLECFKSAFEL